MNSGLTQLDLTFMKANIILKIGTIILLCSTVLRPVVLAKRRTGLAEVAEVEDWFLDA